MVVKITAMLVDGKTISGSMSVVGEATREQIIKDYMSLYAQSKELAPIGNDVFVSKDKVDAVKIVVEMPPVSALEAVKADLGEPGLPTPT